ncbi:carboxymuconolactone decarboxylase family protein [Galbibacter sp. EGI 63066]|uniref:carboxymuconolactone decarboxylase family protein n=1 Tax=Galbibacter sp. EGI 63066 TaxID=2993559 RepID=UPI002248855D|nr:carboxymuconolactone decarboxylase family protein [Galbibacter sp. EGI 63066]MCX2681709.1 carboxymuconolactone decarboxylase family protein [Galbibacter sp. EGI 63066]
MVQIKENDIPAGFYEKLMPIEGYLKNSSLDFQLLELMRLRVSQINKCAYCVDMHHKELKHAGETELRMISVCVWQETPYFSEEERTVLQFAEELTILNNESVSDKLLDKLNQYFSKEKICYLTLAVSQINTWNRLMRTFSFIPGKYEVQKQEELS